jgi:tetratricopeptide (TPR) repeat protein
MVIPVLPFAFGTIAWTAYAERYIYISSAFWTISVCICSSEYLDKREWLPNLYAKNHTLHICLFSLLMIMFFITFKRNLVWRKNIDIIGDTVSLTPEAKPLRGLYMLAYARSGNIFAAKQQYHIANSLYSLQYDEKFDINMASILIDEGDLLEAERYYLIVITKTRGKSLVALKGYLDLLDKSSTQQSNINKQILNIWDKQVDVCNKIYTIDKDPYMLFRLGQFYISANNHIEALENFSKVVKLSPPGSKYHTASLKIISKYSR